MFIGLMHRLPVNLKTFGIFPPDLSIHSELSFELYQLHSLKAIGL